MPRPSGTSYIVLMFLLSLPFTPLTIVSHATSQSAPTPSASREGLGGIWMLNQNLGDAPPTGTGEEGSNRGRGQGRRGGRGGGVAGGIGRGGFGGSGGRQSDEQREDDAARRQAIMNYVRSSSDTSKQLTVVVHQDAVDITDADGRVLTLTTNDKKAEERAENGLIKLTRKSHWDGNTLVSEIEIDNGPKIVRSYALSPGGTQLQISTSVTGGPRTTKFSRFYERPVEAR
jgi:hypothetical protein